MSFITKPIENFTHWAANVSSNKKRVYSLHEGSAQDKSLLGAKGASLCEMTRLGLPVPDGFIITTETCLDYFELNHTESDIDYFVEDKQMPDHLEHSYLNAVHVLERSTGRVFGSGGTESFPLLLAVRSSAAVPIPGMMEAVLNLGMNDLTFECIASHTGNRRFALDIYITFLRQFGHIVLKTDEQDYIRASDTIMTKEGVDDINKLSIKGMEELVIAFKGLTVVPCDPAVQLKMAIEAIFCGWFSDRVRKHRAHMHMIDSCGAAVIIQTMVYGNRNGRSCSGIAYSRHPETGENQANGEFVMRAEGVSLHHGPYAPQPLQELHLRDSHALEKLCVYLRLLEEAHKDAIVVEFTVDDGELFVLESKSAHKSPQASVRIAVDMVKERLLSEREAIMRVDPQHMKYFLYPTIDPVHVHAVICRALKGSTGVASGSAVFSLLQAREYIEQNKPCILVLNELNESELDDLAGVSGLLVMHGGVTSRTVEAARELSIPVVTGASKYGMSISADGFAALDGVRCISSGEIITVDGSHGRVIRGAASTIQAGMDNNFLMFMRWVEKFKRMSVFSSASNLDEATKGADLGADGMGVYRTETVLVQKHSQLLMASLIDVHKGRRRTHMDKLELILQGELEKVFHLFAGKIVTVRLLDPVINGCLPQTDDEIAALANEMEMTVAKCREVLNGLKVSNPILGLRGCRLAILYPHILEMQTRAIMKAAMASEYNDLEPSRLKIMMPMVSTDHEVEDLVPIIRNAASQVFHKEGRTVKFIIGCSMEVPRACMRANAITTEGDVAFLSFDTDQLTELTYGISRYESARMLAAYRDIGILQRDPFESLDDRGVGSLIRLALKLIRRANRFIRIGACGQQSSDPFSVVLYDQLGFDYITCPPLDVPSAKVSAAQAHIKSSLRENMWNKGVFDTPTLDP